MPELPASEAAQHASFSAIRYAQVWEDADVLLDALDIQPTDDCLSIASAGDNALALLTRSPRSVVALDLSAAQLACLAIRVAAFRTLEHSELLALVGSTPAANRADLYQKLRPALAPTDAAFWDARPAALAAGIGHAGKFENYFRLFRSRALPLVHSRRRIDALLTPRALADRRTFYDTTWNSLRWRWLFALFFSRTVMGRLGRDPSFFRYVEGSVADRILDRTRHALTKLAPAENPYLQWILTGTYRTALPCYLRPENFDLIRNNLDRLTWHQSAIEEFLATLPPRPFTKFNLSDIFEYLSPENSERLLSTLLTASQPGARLAYWNMLAPRSRPDSLRHRLAPLPDLATRLHALDKAFFYSAFIVEEAT